VERWKLEDIPDFQTCAIRTIHWR